MDNFKKNSYSITDVAKALRVSACAVRRWIKNGKIEARIDPPAPGKIRPHYSITREMLIKYLETYSTPYDVETLKAFGIMTDEQSFMDIANKTQKKYDPAIRSIKVHSDAIESTTQNDLYAVLIDGRISIANVSRSTAFKIVAILSEENTIHNIQINAVK